MFPLTLTSTLISSLDPHLDPHLVPRPLTLTSTLVPHLDPRLGSDPFGRHVGCGELIEDTPLLFRDVGEGPADGVVSFRCLLIHR